MIEFLLGIMVIALAYLLGSIPFGLLLTKYAGLGDVRQVGSGNIGATNVLRMGNKKIAAATLLLDAGKGVLAVILAKFTGAYWIVALSGVAAIMGHIFPVWLQFKGGKGVATTIAVYWAIYWPLGLFASFVWIVVFYAARISSLSAIMAMLLSPVVALFFGGGFMFLISLFIGGLVVYRHKENIIRLMRGQEGGV